MVENVKADGTKSLICRKKASKKIKDLLGRKRGKETSCFRFLKFVLILYYRITAAL